MVLLVRPPQPEYLMVKPATTKLSSKGQAVIPEEIRRRMGLEPGAQFIAEAELTAEDVASAIAEVRRKS